MDKIGLRNDEQFSKLEVQIIRHHLEEAEVEVDRISSDIAQLYERKQQNIDKVRRYRVAIAPIKKVPEDIIRCIFACLGQDRAIRLPHERDDIPPQVVLSHVCSTWRQIALDMGSLWSHITVSPRNNFRAFCELWLPRITGRSITVDLSSGCTFDRMSDPRLMKDFWKPLAHYQFKNVELVMNNVQLSGLSRMPDDISLQVESVSLARNMYFHIKKWPLLLPQFISRHLHSFRVCGDLEDDEYDFFTPEYYLLPWHQLRRLELNGTGIELPCFARLLQQCTSLEVCSVEVWLQDTADVMPAEQVTLFSLRKLSLVVVQELHLLSATSFLLLPSLRILEIRGGEWTDKVHAVFRNQFNLQQLYELDITHIKFPPPIISILKDASSLRRLCLPQHAVFDEECRRGLANGQLGRHLESLDLFDSSCNVDDIVEMVEIRREARKVISGLAPAFHVQPKHNDGTLRNSYW
ncbi:hypothetical protein APHAL10511_005125 [Amanita phalloides]|nr:hypothetical protein APHAL10511_005125 [Amanita phalloides]